MGAKPLLWTGSVNDNIDISVCMGAYMSIPNTATTLCTLSVPKKKTPHNTMNVDKSYPDSLH